MNHYLSLVILAFCVALVLAAIEKEERGEQVRYFLKLLAYMVLGSLLAAWVMYFHPWW